MPRTGHAHDEMRLAQNPTRQPLAEGFLAVQKSASKQCTAMHVLAKNLDLRFEDGLKASALLVGAMLQKVLHD